MLEAKRMQYEKSGAKVVEALKSRHFDAWYCATGAEAVAKVLELIPEGAEVAWGGSMTVDGLGIQEELRRRGQPLLDRDAVPPEDREKVRIGETVAAGMAEYRMNRHTSLLGVFEDADKAMYEEKHKHKKKAADIKSHIKSTGA